VRKQNDLNSWLVGKIIPVSSQIAPILYCECIILIVKRERNSLEESNKNKYFQGKMAYIKKKCIFAPSNFETISKGK
jgi:hypothetical protein